MISVGKDIEQLRETRFPLVVPRLGHVLRVIFQQESDDCEGPYSRLNVSADIDSLDFAFYPGIGGFARYASTYGDQIFRTL